MNDCKVTDNGVVRTPDGDRSTALLLTIGSPMRNPDKKLAPMRNHTSLSPTKYSTTSRGGRDKMLLLQQVYLIFIIFTIVFTLLYVV